MNARQRKNLGAYYTPDHVVRSLVHWAVREPSDRMLDPSCGDGRFLHFHPNSVGVEHDRDTALLVHWLSPKSLIHQGEFFAWALETHERFECCVGNPPFIRYQKFTGPVRQAALRLCAKQGARFSALSSSWAPFVVGAAGLLKAGGRIAFVVPAEIGHAPYARPLIEYLAASFDEVQIVAIREKLFPELSEDCWLLFAQGFGGETDYVLLSAMERFEFMSFPPVARIRISLTEWRSWNHRLRPFLLPSNIRDLYAAVAEDPGSVRLGRLARVGVGYVTGDNDFFHLRPSQAHDLGIPEQVLLPTVRTSQTLNGNDITSSRVEAWRRCDEPNFLLRIEKKSRVPAPVCRYLDSEAGRRARTSYKCRNRDPWYVVPDVVIPDAFLSYMSGSGALLVANRARCSGSNAVHMVTLRDRSDLPRLKQIWSTAFTRLSCEIEGHPLGGGMLKLEPREAGNVVLTSRSFQSRRELELVTEGILTLRKWRHCG